MTDSRQRLVVHKYTNHFTLASGWQVKVHYFPARIGYATNLHKAQGQGARAQGR